MARRKAGPALKQIPPSFIATRCLQEDTSAVIGWSSSSHSAAAAVVRKLAVPLQVTIVYMLFPFFSGAASVATVIEL